MCTGCYSNPGVMTRPGNEIAERIVACADVAYLQGQVALRTLWEKAGLDSVCVDDMPTQADLTAARERLESL